jgi:hypothetical protein
MHKALEYCFAIKWEVNVQTYKQRNLKNLFCQTECHVVVRCYIQKSVRYWMSDKSPYQITTNKVVTTHTPSDFICFPTNQQESLA